MANLAVLMVAFLSLTGSALATTCEPLSIDRITLHNPGPGEFFGNATTPDTCTDAQLLSCDTSPITDGDFGDTSSGVKSSEFMAWSNNSNITITRVGTDTLVQLRSMKVYFYHDRTVGAGLPQFNLSGSNSEITPGTPIPYAILGNQDLSVGDAQVRNVTLALLLGTDTVVGNRFHIQFFLMSGIQLFAISEIELCTDAATVEAEALVLELSSEPKELVNGSTVRLPANRTGVTEDSVIRLSCTVANQGRFQWSWSVPDSLSPPTQLLLDATRTSMIEVPQNGASLGEYMCTARYHTDTGLNPSSVTETFTVEAQLELYAEERSVSIDSNLVLLECILAGEFSGSGNIQWSYNGQILRDGDKYQVFTANNIDCTYGKCHRSQLQIRQANANDVGTYTCTFEDMSEDITLMNVTVQTPPNGTNPSGSTSNSGTTDDPTTSADLIPIIAGSAGGAGGAILIVIVLILVCCCYNRCTTMKSTNFPQRSNGNVYDDDSDGLYQVISKEIPPPLPSRPPPGSYATVDSKDNGHIELAKLGPPTTTVRDSVVSMPTDFGAPPSDHTLAKLSTTANGQEFNLQYKHNPLYSSADNLISTAPALPEKKFPSTPGILEEESALNIYALPHKPPPLPARMTSPELREASPDPIYTEAQLSPTQFQQSPLHQPSPTLSPSQFQATSPSTESTGSSTGKICPYASIYADPKPLLKEEGPIEVRPYHIKEIRPLGTGQFGEVMLAETRSLSLRDLKLGDSVEKSVSIQVAVKRLKHNADKVVKEAFEKEIKFMARLNHINVIRMLAICPTGQPFILMEYMEFGDLNQYLQKFEVAPSGSEPTESQIAVPSLLYACIQIANGMRYLASLHFIHRDLATRNFLVGKDNIIKIADFGMSRSLYSSHYYRIQGRAILPIRWMANECFYGRFSEKTDVWAYGVSMWEVFMLAKVQPFDELTDQQVIENAVNVEKMKVLSRPQHCPEEVYEVMLRCWEKDPDKRINFEDVYSSLAALHSYSDI